MVRMRWLGVVVVAAAMVLGAVGMASATAVSPAQPVELIAAGPAATYVLASTACGKDDCYSLDRRTASGTVAVTLPKGASPQLVFSGPRDGYALTGAFTGHERVWNTTDGARTWQSVRMPGYVFEIVAADGRFDALVATCTTTRCHDDRLATQAAGADRWTTAAVPGPSIAPKGPAQVDSNTFALAAAGTRVWVYRPSLDRVTVSSDAGRSFAALQEAGDIDGVWDDMTATSASTVWCECGTGLYVAIQRSTNDGITFQALGRPTRPNGTSGFLFTALSNTRALYSPGLDSRAVQVTTDGGQHFTTVGKLPFKGGEGREWLFRTDERGLLIGAGHLYSTSNGGRSWRSIGLPAN